MEIEQTHSRERGRSYIRGTLHPRNKANDDTRVSNLARDRESSENSLLACLVRQSTSPSVSTKDSVELSCQYGVRGGF